MYTIYVAYFVSQKYIVETIDHKTVLLQTSSTVACIWIATPGCLNDGWIVHAEKRMLGLPAAVAKEDYSDTAHGGSRVRQAASNVWSKRKPNQPNRFISEVIWSRITGWQLSHVGPTNKRMYYHKLRQPAVHGLIWHKETLRRIITAYLDSQKVSDMGWTSSHGGVPL